MTLILLLTSCLAVQGTEGFVIQAAVLLHVRDSETMEDLGSTQRQHSGDTMLLAWGGGTCPYYVGDKLSTPQEEKASTPCEELTSVGYGVYNNKWSKFLALRIQDLPGPQQGRPDDEGPTEWIGEDTVGMTECVKWDEGDLPDVPMFGFHEFEEGLIETPDYGVNSVIRDGIVAGTVSVDGDRARISAKVDGTTRDRSASDGLTRAGVETKGMLSLDLTLPLCLVDAIL